jgi:hypothetical protein
VAIFAIAMLSACATLPPRGSNFRMTMPPPTEADAAELQTKYATSAEVRKELGEPGEVKMLEPVDGGACRERWSYLGQFDVGLGPMDILSYVDFDAEGRVCHQKKGA